jgi:hypothetical protein
MERLIENRRIAAILGVLLVIPGAFLFAMLSLNIEPPFGPLDPYLRRSDGSGPHVIGSLIALNAIVVLPLIALIINIAPVMRSLRDRKGMPDRRTNVVVAAAAVIVVMMFISAIAVDQYPCWVGVPNCD